jgi:hypothetical protein
MLREALPGAYQLRTKHPHQALTSEGTRDKRHEASVGIRLMTRESCVKDQKLSLSLQY